MPDPQNPENTGELHESPLSPAEDERIRRLLAEARHTAPMPDAVVARLDRVLSGLAGERAERAERASQAQVVDLAARRRRTAGQLLVAAAAVVAVGFGITQVLPNVGSGSDDSPSAVTAEENADAGDAAGEDGSARNASPESAPEAPSATSGDAKSAFRISSDEFGSDVRRVRNEVELDSDTASLFEYPTSGCLTAPIDAGSKVVAAMYDGAPAAVVLKPPSGDVQVVDLYLCGDVEPRRSITLMAP
jgi:hypothetical protein